MRIATLSDTKANLPKLIERVPKCEEDVTVKAGKPVGKLVPNDIDTRPRDLEPWTHPLHVVSATLQLAFESPWALQWHRRPA